MLYSKKIIESLKKVEATRSIRLGQNFCRLDAVQRKELLKSFHPDYIQEKKRVLRVGPNKGDKVDLELANVIEAYSFIEPEKINLSKIDFDVDVLVVGSGGAGISASIEAFYAGANTMLVTKLRLGDANTIMAQGGIQAADKKGDSPAEHYLDVMGGGHFSNTPELVRTLTENAPEVVSWLEDLGVMFDKEENGDMITLHGAGTSRRRMHSASDYTGMEILRVMRDEFINLKIPYREFCSAVELIKDSSGKVAGVVLFDMETHKFFVCKAKAVVMATGGMGRLHIQGFPCTNHYGATADGIVLGNRAGVPFIFMDAVQYHPTGVAFPEQIKGLLVTEKVRSLGAHLVNVDAERFIYELLPRDVVSSGIIREVRAHQKGVNTSSGMSGVWLDVPLIDLIHGKGAIKKELPALYKQYEKFSIKIDEEPILVYPTQHYQNGGLLINTNAQTTVNNLFSPGELAGGIHGINRLMGNSLLDILVFGRRAGCAAADVAKNISLGRLTLEHVVEHNKNIKELDIPKERRSPILLPSYGIDFLL